MIRNNKMNYKKLPELRNQDDKVVDPEKAVKKKQIIKFPILYKLNNKRLDTMEIWAEGSCWSSRWGLKDGEKQTAKREGEVKNEDRSNQLTAEEDALYQAFSHWNEVQKKKGYSIDMDCDDVSNIFPLIAMTTQDVKKREALKSGFDWSKKYILQPKLDGHRCTSGVDPTTNELVLVSRSRDPIFNIKKIRKHLEKIHEKFPEVYLDGELYCHELSRQKISSIVRKKKDKDKDEDKIIFYIFDCCFSYNLKKTYQERIDWIHKNVEESENVKILSSYDSNGTKEDVEEYLHRCVYLGYEGCMIKLQQGVYKPGKRTSEVLKMKIQLEMDVLITGFTEAKGVQKGMIVFICKTEKGKQFSSVPAWTHEKRKKAFLKGDSYIGRIAVISYFSLSDDGIPEFNVMRDIKDREQ